MVVLIIVWLGASVAVGYAGAQRGRSGMSWFLLALAITPLLAVLVLLACPMVEEAATEFAPDHQPALDPRKMTGSNDFYRPYLKTPAAEAKLDAIADKARSALSLDS